MRIGLNLLYLIPKQVGGTQTYAEHLVSALADEGPEHEYWLFVNSEGASLPWPRSPNFHMRVLNFPAHSRAARYAHEQLALPRAVRAERIDVLHSLGYVSPLVLPCPSVVSIHDAVHVGYPMSAARRALLGFFVKHSARRADRVLTLSEFSKREIVRHVGIPASRVTVTEAGPRQMPERRLSTPDELASRYNITTPFIAAYSGVHAHKNMVRLIEAFDRISSDVPHSLVIIGRLPPDGNVQAAIEHRGLTNRVRITGYVPDEDLMPLLEQAAVFVFPSWYEGFGLPVLDAQRAGVPVACSTAASLPEVAGDGAIFFDPFSVEEMSDALRRCALDESLRSELVARGSRNVGRFSWANAARQALGVYRDSASRQPAVGLLTSRKLV